MTRRVSSYDPKARVPAVGTRWVWEIDQPAARALIEVVEVVWNGEEWWVWTTSLLAWHWPPSIRPGPAGNDLGRFVEACEPIGCHRGVWRTHRVEPGVRSTWRGPDRGPRELL